MYEISVLIYNICLIKDQSELAGVESKIYHYSGSLEGHDFLSATIIIPDLETMVIDVVNKDITVNRIPSTLDDVVRDLERLYSYLSAVEEANG